MAARDDLFERIHYFVAALTLEVIKDDNIGDSVQNGTAQVLRRGLGIVGFNILEDFIKARTAECLSAIAQSGISFSNLPEKLREAATFNALKALNFQCELVKKDSAPDAFALVQDHAFQIASSRDVAFRISPFSFASSGSNVTSNDVSEIISSFGFQQGWNKLKEISDSVGGGILDLAQSYRNAASRRHKAAHTAGFNYELQWLLSLPREIRAISASLDLALTSRCYQVQQRPNRSFETGGEPARKLRFLQPTERGAYAECLSIGGRSLKNWPSLATGISELLSKVQTKGEILIVLDRTKRVESWHS